MGADGGFDFEAGDVLAATAKHVLGARVDKLGNSSVVYGIGIFRDGSSRAAAHGYFVHVFVDRETRKPVPIPAGLRKALAAIAV